MEALSFSFAIIKDVDDLSKTKKKALENSLIMGVWNFNFRDDIASFSAGVNQKNQKLIRLGFQKSSSHGYCFYHSDTISLNPVPTNPFPTNVVAIRGQTSLVSF